MPNFRAGQVSSLPLLDRNVLGKLWEEVFDSPPSAKFRRDFMIPVLAYRLQEQAFGPLNTSSRRRLEQLARSLESSSNLIAGGRLHLRPGTRLVRQWADRVHIVNVERSGYEYDGVRYKSLSRIARLITGTRWSGPLFFGIKHSTSRRSRALEVA